MMKLAPTVSTLALVFALGVGTASAQGLVRGTESGAASGAATGGAAAGPVGAAVGGVVGGAVGAATGVVGGILGVDQRPRFHSYVVRQGYPSYNYTGGPLVVGSVLPGSGVTYYDVPAEYGVRDYRYTVVNGRTVLVEPGTGRIVDIID